MQLTAKTERYKVNQFKKGTIEAEKDSETKKFNYYIRPFIPFWRVQQLNFDQINSFNDIPKVNENTCPRYVLHDLVKTWISENPGDIWFDRKDIFDLLRHDLILRIQSKLPTETLRKSHSM